MLEMLTNIFIINLLIFVFVLIQFLFGGKR